MMATNMRWDEFAEAAVRRLINPEKGRPFLILADTATDPGLAQELLVAGIRYGADTQLSEYERKEWGERAVFGPIVGGGQFWPVSTFFQCILIWSTRILRGKH